MGTAVRLLPRADRQLPPDPGHPPSVLPGMQHPAGRDPAPYQGICLPDCNDGIQERAPFRPALGCSAHGGQIPQRHQRILPGLYVHYLRGHLCVATHVPWIGKGIPAPWRKHEACGTGGKHLEQPRAVSRADRRCVDRIQRTGLLRRGTQPQISRMYLPGKAR